MRWLWRVERPFRYHRIVTTDVQQLRQTYITLCYRHLRRIQSRHGLDNQPTVRHD